MSNVRAEKRARKKALLKAKKQGVIIDDTVDDPIQLMKNALGNEDKPITVMTTECHEKGAINMDSDGEDNRCADPECVICRSFDKVTGVVDRHLLSEDEKKKLEAADLERQQEEQALEKAEEEEYAETVDFEEITEKEDE